MADQKQLQRVIWAAAVRMRDSANEILNALSDYNLKQQEESIEQLRKEVNNNG